MERMISLGLCTVTVSLLLSGCSGGTARQTNRYLSVYEEKDMLPPAIDSVISEYEGEHPNVDFKVYDPTAGDTSMTGENAIKKMDADIMVGKGPDLIIAETSDMDVYKMAKAGAFCDVNQFIRKDSLFDMKDYNRVVLNAGVIGGKRYIVPLEYHLPVLLTTKEKMEKAGFRLTANTNAESFNNEALRALEQNSTASIFNQDGYGKLWSFQFPDAFDFTKEQATFDTPQFKKTMTLCKEEYIREKKYPELAVKVNPSPEYTEYMERYAQNDILFDQTTGVSWQIAEGTFFQTFGQAELIPVYNDAGGLTAQVSLFAAISADSPNGQNAYDFLKAMLSPTLMSELDIPVLNSETSSVIRVVRNTIDREIDSSKAEADMGFPEEKLPESFYQECTSYPAKVNRVILNMTPYDELLEQFQPYFEGKETYEKCLKDAKNYFDLYMSE